MFSSEQNLRRLKSYTGIGLHAPRPGGVIPDRRAEQPHVATFRELLHCAE